MISGGVHWSDLVGYVLAVLSIILAVIMYYKSKIQQHELDSKLDRANLETDRVQKSFERFSSAVHNVAFDALLKVKNVPSDLVGMARQRDALVSNLRDLQTMAKSEAPNLALTGEIIFGTELGQFENDNDVTETWLVSNDLRPDADEPDLLQSVSINLSKGKRYTYVVPDDIDDEIIQKLLSGIRSELLKLPEETEPLENVLNVVALSRRSNRRLFSAGGIALYVYGAGDNFRGQKVHVIGFDEVVLPNERRGALWQRQSDLHAESTYTLLRDSTDEHERKGNVKIGASPE